MVDEVGSVCCRRQVVGAVAVAVDGAEACGDCAVMVKETAVGRNAMRRVIRVRTDVERAARCSVELGEFEQGRTSELDDVFAIGIGTLVDEHDALRLENDDEDYRPTADVGDEPRRCSCSIDDGVVAVDGIADGDCPWISIDRKRALEPTDRAFSRIEPTFR